MIDFKQLACLNRDELLENVVPFWLTHSQDERYGGYFTCLDRGGDVYDTDKFVWLQGRQVWLFSMLYNQVEKRPEWLECAVQGAEFLRKHGHDGNYNWYFSLTREGRPLVAPYNIFSYTFATMAFAQAALATGSDQYAEIAKRTFARILEKRDNPKGPWCKTVPGTRDLKDFALPMILCNMALEAEQMIDPALLDATIRDCIHQVMEVFYRGELGLIVENVAADGELSDSFEGRQINPGHSLEAMWFIMNLGVRLNDRALIDKAVKIALDTAEYGWDKEYGGLFYFMDRLGHPQQQLEWDQKLWWVHIEAMIAMIKKYDVLEGGMPRCLRQHEDDQILAFEKKGCVFVFNFHPTRSQTGLFVPVPENGDYQVVLSTDDKVFGGYQNIDKTVIYHTWAHDPQMGDGFVIYLPARTAVVLRKVEKKKD